MQGAELTDWNLLESVALRRPDEEKHSELPSASASW